MKVYVLYESDYEDRYTHGVFATVEAAQASPHNGHDGVWTEGEWWCQWRAVHEAINPEPVTFTFTTREIPVVDGVATLPDGTTVRTSAQKVVVPEYDPDALPVMFSRPEWTESCSYYIDEWTVQE